jgi:hypothetical protein
MKTDDEQQSQPMHQAAGKRKTGRWPAPLDLKALAAQAPSARSGKFYFECINGEELVTVQWGGYDYWIEMHRIPSPLALLQWIAHWGAKGWKGMTSDEISAFVEAVCERKGWKLHEKNY